MEQLLADEESLAVVCVAIVGIVAILVFGLGGMIVSIVKTNANARLKQQMLDRGMTPSEIEQVIKAGSDDFKKKWLRSEKSVSPQPEDSAAPGSKPPV